MIVDEIYILKHKKKKGIGKWIKMKNKIDGDDYLRRITIEDNIHKYVR